jgi:hypothetical protein
MVIFRVTGRDSYELASQFDNSPPAADTRVEPIYQGYDFQGIDVLVEAEYISGPGKIYREVELPKRPYSDVEAERANTLSVLPDYYAWCRLLRKPEENKGNPKLFEVRVKTDHMTAGKGNPAMATYIKERSRMKAKTREAVENEILSREFRIIQEPLSSTEENKR